LGFARGIIVQVRFCLVTDNDNTNEKLAVVESYYGVLFCFDEKGEGGTVYSTVRTGTYCDSFMILIRRVVGGRVAV
jgi:hypothetical protein